MAVRLSRRQLATYAANELLTNGDRDKLIRRLAAYLVSTHRLRELDLIVRDIERILAERGHVVADVESAHALTSEQLAHIRALTGGTNVELRESVDESLLGGIRLRVPDKEYDNTLKKRIGQLRSIEV